MNTIYTLAAIAAGMLVGAAGASLVIKEHKNGITNSTATFGWLGVFLLLIGACTVSAHCQHLAYQNDHTNFLTLFSLSVVEFYGIVAGALIRCIPGVISDLKAGVKAEWPSLISGTLLIVLPFGFWINGPHLFNRFDSFALASFWGLGISLFIYVSCSFCFWTVRKLA